MKSYLNALKQYGNFKTRSTRSEYWRFYFANLVIYIGLVAIGAILSSNPNTKPIGTVFVLLASLYTLATLIPSFAVASRRCHDVGKSGWYLIVPIYNLILLVSPSVPEPNQWGPNPNAPKKSVAVPPPFKLAA